MKPLSTYVRNGCSDGQNISLTQYELCRASASSGESLIDLWQNTEEAEPIRADTATTPGNDMAALHARASALLRESDFSNLYDPVLRDIAVRNHAHSIAEYLQAYSQTPLAPELEGVLTVLRSEAKLFAKWSQS